MTMRDFLAGASWRRSLLLPINTWLAYERRVLFREATRSIGRRRRARFVVGSSCGVTSPQEQSHDHRNFGARDLVANGIHHPGRIQSEQPRLIDEDAGLRDSLERHALLEEPNSGDSANRIRLLEVRGARYPLNYPLPDTCLKRSPAAIVAGNNNKRFRRSSLACVPGRMHQRRGT